MVEKKLEITEEQKAMLLLLTQLFEQYQDHADALRYEQSISKFFDWLWRHYLQPEIEEVKD